MATKLGSTTISKLYLGSTEITKAYLGSTEVYSSGAPVTNDAFELTVETTAANETFLLPMLGVTSIDVDWGDGTVDTGITSDNPTHTYATAGTHSISVTGNATKVQFDGSGSELKLRTVTNFGALGWTDLSSAFRDCSSMTSFVCSDTDTSSVTRMDRMFQSCTSATTIDVSGFNTSSVTNMLAMFENCNSVIALDVSGFDTSSTTSTIFMFYQCFAITTLDVSGFDMSSATQIRNMFTGCSSLANLDIDGWDVTSITNATDFLNGANLALTTTQYDELLIAWAAQSVQSNVTIHFGDAQYTGTGASAAARETLISTYGWTITDGGPVYEANGIEPEFVADFANDYYRVASNESTFDSALTFSRSGNATMVDSDGLIKWAPHNVIDESEFANGTDPVAGGWVDASSGAYSATTFVNGLGETVGAVTATMTNSAPRHRYPLSGLDSNGTYTVEVWIGPSTTITGICLQVTGFTNISGTTTANVEDADANGRIAITFTLDTDVAGDLYIGRPFGNTTGVIEMGGVSLYRSDLGGMVNNPDRGDSYVPTTGSAAYLARRGHHVYNGTSWVNEGILVESESRINFVTNSEDFSGYVDDDVSLASGATSPSGGSTATTVTENTITDWHGLRTAPDLTVDSTKTYTQSVFVKAGTRDKCAILLGYNRVGGLTLDTRVAKFDLTTQEVFVYDASITGNIENVGNGWYRCSATKQASVSGTHGNNAGFYIVDQTTTSDLSYTGSGTDSMIFWGFQLEEGSTPSSYIPTSGSTVTRAAEILTVPAANVSAGETAYSIAIDAYIQAKSADKPDPLTWFGADSDLYRHEYRGTSMLVNQRIGAGNNNNNFLPISDSYKIASRGSTTENQTAANGTAAEVDVQSGNPGLSNKNINLGQHPTGGDTLQTIKSLILWDDDIGTAGIEEASS